jgi:hypothetical protein
VVPRTKKAVAAAAIEADTDKPKEWQAYAAEGKGE